jgi:hypothetical protein
VPLLFNKSFCSACNNLHAFLRSLQKQIVS